MKKRRIALSMGFLAPAYLFIIYAFLVPGIWNLILSFQEWDGFNEKVFVLFDNYKEALQDEVFLQSLVNSVAIAVITMIGATLAGLVLALMIYRLGRREGAFYRLILFMPAMIPVSIIGLLFTFIYNSDMGLLNQFLEAVHLDHLTTAWLENADTVLPSIIIVGIWRLQGMPMMLCYVSLQQIPDSLIDAAKIDGATYWKRIFWVMMPLVKPTIGLSMIFVLLNAFKTYDLVYVLTRGGPANASMTVPIYMQKAAFSYGQFSYSSTMGVLTAIAVILVVFAVQRIMKGERYEF